MGRKKIEVKIVDGKFPKIMYGLKGISTIFNVSSSTAFKMSNTTIKDACQKKGGIILVDTKKALELFGFPNPEDFIQ